MYLTVSREEVETLIREKYNLPDEVKVYINDGALMAKNMLNKVYGDVVQSNNGVLLYHDTDSIADMKVTVNNENQVQDIRKEPLPKKVHSYPPKLSKEELDAVYERYADTVEEFLKSGKKEQFIDLEGYSATGMRYRYNTAIKMYGFEDQCYASATDHARGDKSYARLIRKEK